MGAVDASTGRRGFRGGAPAIAWLLLAWCCLYPPPAPASALYQAYVPVADNGSAEYRRALRAALAEVLVKVTGNPAASSLASLQPLMNDPARAVAQFRYVEGGAEPGTDRRAPLWLFVQFDRAAIDRAVQDAGLAALPEQRASLLCWLAVERDGERFVVGADGPPPYPQALARAAARRGLPVLLPLWDLEDQQRLRFVDLWADFSEPVLEASRRYPVDAVLVVRLRRSDATAWEADATLYRNGRRHAWRERSADALEAIERSIDRALEQTVTAAPPAPVVQDEWTLRVEGVHTMRDYLRAAQALESIPAVRALRIRAAGAGRVEFAVAFGGDAWSLHQALAEPGVLQRVPAPADAPQRTLWYRFTP